jgi:hypothetical protein
MDNLLLRVTQRLEELKYFPQSSLRAEVTRLMLETALSEEKFLDIDNVNDMSNAVGLIAELLAPLQLPYIGPAKADTVNSWISIVKAKPAEQEGSLSEALSKYKTSVSKGEPTKKLFTFLTKDGARKLYIRIPNIHDKPKDLKDQMAMYIDFTAKCACLTTNEIYLIVDPELPLPALPVKVRNKMRSIVASIKSQSGQIDLTEISLSDKVKTTLPGVIACLASLTKYFGYVRKCRSDACNLEVLKNALDLGFGLKEPGTSPFPIMWIRQTLSLITGLDSGLPSNFYKVARDTLKVKSIEGILFRLGYKPIQPSLAKIVALANLTFSEERKADDEVHLNMEQLKPKDLVPIDKTYIGLVKFITPNLSLNDKSSLKNQVNRPIRGISHKAREFYVKNINSRSDLDKAYAIVASATRDKPSDKTKPSHCKNAIGKLVNGINTHNENFMDYDGTSYKSYNDLPHEWRSHLQKLLKRRTLEAKPSDRKREASDEVSLEDIPDDKRSKPIGNDPKSSTASKDGNGDQSMQIS